jgi:hypothetical protein
MTVKKILSRFALTLCFACSFNASAQLENLIFNQNDSVLSNDTQSVRLNVEMFNYLRNTEYFDLMEHFRYIVPQGGPMSGIGNDLQIVSLSNCDVKIM